MHGRRNTLARLTLIAAALFLFDGRSAWAQTYPAKSIRMVVPFPTGGATDIIARVIADKLGPALGTQVLVDNRAGAGGAIGSEQVAKAPADGYTILMATSSTHSVAPALNAKLPYQVERDFAPVAHVASSPSVLIIGPNVQATSVQQLIALAKARPTQLTFSSSGIGTIVHLSGELFANMAGVQIVHVPYKGTQLAIPDIINGQVTMMFDNIVSAMPHIRSGKVKALAMGSAKRSGLLPELPTIDEAGLPGYVSDAYFGVFAPAATPRDIVARMANELARIVELVDVRERLLQQGAEPVGGDPESFARVIRADTVKWSKVIREAGVKLE